MLSNRHFHQKDVEAAEKIYLQVKLDPVPRNIVTSFGKFIHEFIPMNELAIRGFALMAIKKWQIEHKQEVSEIMTMSVESRIVNVREMIVFLEEKLSKTLINQAHAPKVQDALQKFIKSYSMLFEKLVIQTWE